MLNEHSLFNLTEKIKELILAKQKEDIAELEKFHLEKLYSNIYGYGIIDGVKEAIEFLKQRWGIK